MNKGIIFILLILLFSYLSALSPSKKMHQFVKNEYTRKEGLPTNLVRTVVQTPDGFIWLATSSGIVRFDGNKFTSFTHLNTKVLPSSTITLLYVDKFGTMWIGTDSGIVTYSNGKWERFKNNSDLTTTYVTAILKTSEKYLWVGTDKGLYLYSGKEKTATRYSTKDGLSSNMINSLEDNFSGNIFIGTDNGLSVLKGGKFADYHISKELEGMEINSIYKDREKNIWICTSKNGLKLYNNGNFIHKLKGMTVYTVLKDRDGTMWAGVKNIGFTKLDDNFEIEGKIAKKFPRTILEDREGNIWLGSDDGVTAFKDGIITMLTTDDGLPDNQVSSITEDNHYNLWVSTIEGGIVKFGDKPLYYNQKNQFLATDTVASLFAKDGRIWAGSWHGGLYLFDGDKIELFTDEDFLSGNSIRTVFVDSKKRVWIAINDQGINLIHNNSSTEFSKKDGLVDINITAFFETAKGDILIGTENGLNIYQDGKFSRFSDISSEVNFIHEDKEHNIWIATKDDGMIVKYGDKFHKLSIEDGLPDRTLHAILDDDEDNLWISSSFVIFRVKRNSIIKYLQGKLKKIDVEIYNENDGLTGNETMASFQTGSYKSKSGVLYFSTPNGVAIIKPGMIKKNEIVPGVKIERVNVDDSDVESDGEIVLSPSADKISFEFSAISFKNSEKIRIKYLLEGYNNDWQETKERSVYFTNLPPGSYTFRVKASNNDGVWNETGASIFFVKTPFFYQTVWFYILMSFLTILLVYLYILKREHRLKIRQKELEKINTRLQNLDKMKDEFVANTSHELRTPLNGIIGLAESLIDSSKGKVENDHIYGLNTIIDSGRRLSALVNDILDFSKLKSSNIAILKKPINLKDIVDSVVALTNPLLKGKSIDIKIQISEKLIAVDADENRLFQIFYNLVGNAIKFTKQGKITISAEQKGPMVEVSITNTGIGIPAEKLTTIFKSFEQVDSSTTRKFGGTGLGLYITKQLVELHHGHIGVESEVGAGSRFYFTLQTTKDKPVNIMTHKVIERTESAKPKKEKGIYTVLMVDDDAINHDVVSRHLEDLEYNIKSFIDGKEVLNYVENNEKPDLILLDVMMPELSGYEVCKKIRQKYSSAELPVIMLTAKNQKKDLVDGFTVGANDFITKPFSKKELLARIEAHLDIKDSVESQLSELKSTIKEQDQIIQEQAEKYGESRLSAERINAIHEELQKLMKEKKLYLNPILKLEDVRKPLRISQRELSQTIKRVYDFSFPNYLSMHRIEEVAGKIVEPEYRDKTILEVAFEVGFNNKATFNTAFKKFKGMTPKQYQSENKKW